MTVRGGGDDGMRGGRTHDRVKKTIDFFMGITLKFRKNHV